MYFVVIHRFYDGSRHRERLPCKVHIEYKCLLYYNVELSNFMANLQDFETLEYS
jgi:hypothetical protein